MALPGPSRCTAAPTGAVGGLIDSPDRSLQPQQSRFGLTFNASVSPRGGKNQHLCGFKLRHQAAHHPAPVRRGPGREAVAERESRGELKIEPGISKEAVGRRAKPGQSEGDKETGGRDRCET